MNDLYEGLTKVSGTFSVPGYHISDSEDGSLCPEDVSCADLRTELRADFRRFKNNYDRENISEEIKAWLREQDKEHLINRLHEVGIVDPSD